jgi:hypothetical protein
MTDKQCEALARTVMMDQTYHDTVLQQRKWQGLTDEERLEIIAVGGEAAVLYVTEAKLREKNSG